MSGRWGHSSERERDKDARRINDLQEHGCTVLELTSLAVRSDPQYVVATVPPGPPPGLIDATVLLPVRFAAPTTWNRRLS